MRYLFLFVLVVGCNKSVQAPADPLATFKRLGEVLVQDVAQTASVDDLDPTIEAFEKEYQRLKVDGEWTPEQAKTLTQIRVYIPTIRFLTETYWDTCLLSGEDIDPEHLSEHSRRLEAMLTSLTGQ